LTSSNLANLPMRLNNLCFVVSLCLFGFVFLPYIHGQALRHAEESSVEFEDVEGKVWVSSVPTSLQRFGKNAEITVKVWFDRQLLGDGKAYQRRTTEWDGIPSSVLRERCLKTMKRESQRSFLEAKKAIDQLKAAKTLTDIRQHWIINGFSATTRIADLEKLQEIPGISKVFIIRKTDSTHGNASTSRTRENSDEFVFDSERWLHPWYTRALKADQVWKKLGISGKGTLNVIHDFHFPNSPQMAESQAPIVGFNFNDGSPQLSVRPKSESVRDLHGVMCAAIVCGRGSPEFKYEFGIAPSGEWAGVISRGEIESSVEWAIENGADTYSMSFSIPALGEYRSHWRKILEHGTICGLCFVSGAGNFAKTARIPRQMRTPEDIPQAVFAAAGVQRDLTKTVFSSQGPVQWQTEHYRDGKVRKPEVCAFNHQLPVFFENGNVNESAINGNSFAGPMFCGAIALMRSADKEIHPWRIREIITSTATDIGSPGFDASTGHGLINCYQAVREVLRLKASREGEDPAKFDQTVDSDLFNVKKYLAELSTIVVIESTGRESPRAETNGLKAGDVITAIDGEKLNALTHWNDRIENSRKKSIELKVIRDGESFQISMNTESLADYKIREAYSAPVFK